MGSAPETSRGIVWVVDDSPLQREALRRVLAQTFRVEAFGEGTEVIERIAVTSALPDAIVVGWRTPDGKAEFRLVRNDGQKRVSPRRGPFLPVLDERNPR